LKMLALSSSPRKGGNTDLLLDAAIESAVSVGAVVDKLYLSELKITPCRGCLRCNVLGRCVISDDDWHSFAEKFVSADAVLIGAPVYFWGVPGVLKVLLDRFRSLIEVTMGREHITCVPREWKPKDFGFILAQGEPTGEDFVPALRSLHLFAQKVSRGGRIAGEVVAKGPAFKGQVALGPERLTKLFEKAGVEADAEFVTREHRRYQGYFETARKLGAELGAPPPASGAGSR